MPGLLPSRLDLACDPSAVHDVRIQAKGVLDSWGLRGEVVDDVLLVVGELATNAVMHAGGAVEPMGPLRGQPRIGSCVLVLRPLSGRLCVSVYDEGSERPVLRDVPADSESGRGLRMVAGITRGEWGFELLVPGPGKLVWAMVPTPGLLGQALVAGRRAVGLSSEDGGAAQSAQGSLLVREHRGTCPLPQVVGGLREGALR